MLNKEHLWRLPEQCPLENAPVCCRNYIAETIPKAVLKARNIPQPPVPTKFLALQKWPQPSCSQFPSHTSNSPSWKKVSLAARPAANTTARERKENSKPASKDLLSLPQVMCFKRKSRPRSNVASALPHLPSSTVGHWKRAVIALDTQATQHAGPARLAQATTGFREIQFCPICREITARKEKGKGKKRKASMWSCTPNRSDR